MEECSFTSWYPRFSRHSVESIAIPIQNDVLTYLREGTLILPKEAVPPPRQRSSSSSDWSDSDADSDEAEQPSFPAFSAQLKDAMNQLGGEVFIKTNWSAPKDAKWIATNKSLKCRRLEEIYLLLKSSDFVANDLSYQLEGGQSSGGSGYYVVLKQWKDIHPGTEYRCFVIQNQLIAISQRDCTSYYEHIQKLKFEILDDLVQFYRRNIHKKAPLETYTLDVVREGRGRVTLLDVGPLTERSAKTPLFTWPELQELLAARSPPQPASAGGAEAADTPAFDPEFRFLGEDPGLQPNQCQHFGVPFEVSDLCSMQESMSIIEHITEAVRQQNGRTEES
ncbi:cell division cycle protein 123 homolog [Schistocerca gregaria]|uniref:cell division cycle protein 123 homolog n=1 Tax=Schistocerca gregaria TaxID=7010 RepID=UPI00211EA316|nr:cell division cycle protein 123 homolog [Schistocerca gregaria]